MRAGAIRCHSDVYKPTIQFTEKNEDNIRESLGQCSIKCENLSYKFPVSFLKNVERVSCVWLED